MKKRWIALLLALVMLLGALTGCGKTEANDGTDGNAPAETETSETPVTSETGETPDADGSALTQVPAEARQDPIAYVTDGAIHSDDIVMTVGGTDIPASVYFYWLNSQYSSSAYTYMSYGYTLDVTEAVDEEGHTVADALAKQAEQMTTLNAVLKEKAQGYGVTLTDEQQAALGELSETYDSDMLTYYTTTLDGITDTYQASYLATNLQAALYGEGGAEEPTAETLADYAEESGAYNCRYILFYTADLEEGDDEGRAAKLAEAQATYDELAACAPDALEETFAQLQAERNHDGNTEPFSFNAESSLADGFRETVASVNEGELALSGETMYGYFVILRLPVDTDALREKYVSGAFDTLLGQWLEEASVEKTAVMEELDAVGTLKNIQALQEALITELSAANADSDTAE